MTSNRISAVLRRGRDTAIARGHPWVFSGAVRQLDGDVRPGAEVDVRSHDGQWLGRGLLNPEADLLIRIYDRDPDSARPLSELFADRVCAAVAKRARWAAVLGDGDACRLVFSESDGLSGLIVDRYADTLSVRVAARVLAPYLGGIVETLREVTGCTGVHLAAEAGAAREGLGEADLPPVEGEAPQRVRIRQDGLQFEVDPRGGQKTGFYLDQRINRRRVARYATGARVLSAYCYTGAFEVYAASAGARELTGIDESADAMEQARAHLALNGITVPAVYERASVPAALRAYRDRDRRFDLIVLDPPRFVARRDQLEKGLRAYKDINLLALKLLAPGGVLATFSCSGLVDRAAFRRAVEWAAADAGRPVQMVEQLGQPPDHPVLLAFPESEYLKGLVCTVE